MIYILTLACVILCRAILWIRSIFVIIKTLKGHIITIFVSTFLEQSKKIWIPQSNSLILFSLEKKNKKKNTIFPPNPWEHVCFATATSILVVGEKRGLVLSQGEKRSKTTKFFVVSQSLFTYQVPVGVCLLLFSMRGATNIQTINTFHQKNITKLFHSLEILRMKHSKMLSWLTVYANRKPLVHNPYPSTCPSHVNRPPERKITKKNCMS